MRTTIDIDDEVLLAAKELARRQNRTAGQVISQLLRQAMTQPAAAGGTQAREADAFYGFRPFSSRGGLVSDETVERLRDQEGV